MNGQLQRAHEIGPFTKAADLPAEHIIRLCHSLDLGDVTLNHLRFALSGLTKATIPPPGSGPDHPANQRATPCLRLLLKTLLACRSNAPLLDQSVPILVQACDGVCAWIHQLLLEMIMGHMSGNRQSEKMQTLYRERARVLLSIISLHPTVSRAYLRSDEFLNVSMYLWTSSDPAAGRKHVFFMNWDSPEEDYIIQLILKIVQDPAGRNALLRKSNHFTHRAKKTPFAAHVPEGLKRLCTALLQRTMQMRQAIETPRKFIPGMVHFSGYVMQILENLCETEDDDLYKHLNDANYLTEFALLIRANAAAVGKAAAPELLEIVLNIVETFVRIVRKQHTATAQNWRKAVAGKIIPAIAHLAIDLDYDGALETQRNQLATLSQTLSIITLYPRVLDLLIESPWLMDTRSLTDALKSPRAAAIWDPFWNTVQTRLEIYKEQKSARSLGLCDNPLCTTAVRQSTMTCGKCSSVVYCSRKCQYLDWIGTHRKECRSAREHHRAGHTTQTLYSHRTRAFHVKLLESFSASTHSPSPPAHPGAGAGKAPLLMLDFCPHPPSSHTKHPPPSSSSSPSSNPNLTPNPNPNPNTNPTLNLLLPPTPQTTFDMRDGTSDQWFRRPDTQFPQRYLQPRLRAFGRQVAPEVQAGRVRVVEGRFPVAQGVVAHTVVALAKVALGKKEGLGTVGAKEEGEDGEGEGKEVGEEEGEGRWEATYCVTRVGNTSKGW